MSFGTDPTAHNGRLRGDNAGGCPGMLFSVLTFATSDVGFFGSVDFSGLSQADYESSADPIADLLGNMAQRYIAVKLTGEWGTLQTESFGGTIHQVPEPAPLALFGAAAIGF